MASETSSCQKLLRLLQIKTSYGPSMLDPPKYVFGPFLYYAKV